MDSEKPGYIDVDQLQSEARLEDVLAFYGVDPGCLQRVGREVRSRCFLACGRSEETGDRALAIREGDPVRRWHCHQYDCGRGGNLVSLIDLLKEGANGDGRPRGVRFKAIRDDLVAIVRGDPRPAVESTPPPTSTDARQRDDEDVKRNVPIVRSNNVRARTLADLDEKFVTGVAAMPPAAARYFRDRPFLTPDVCERWRVGYLPQDSGGDRSGGTMRGRIVYGYQSTAGEVLTWFGRDPDFERRHTAWVAGGRSGAEPIKTRFVKGFRRSLELYGQQASRLDAPGYRETLERIGLIVVEGPNDVIALDSLGVPSVALCSNTVSAEQARTLADWASRLAGGTVTLLLDCDEEGQRGAKQALPLLAEQCRVRLAWSEASHGGAFRGRQPESLSPEEWQEIEAHLTGIG